MELIKNNQLQLQLLTHFTDEEIDKMVKEAEANKEEDAKKKEEADVKNEARTISIPTEKAIKDLR